MSSKDAEEKIEIVYEGVPPEDPEQAEKAKQVAVAVEKDESLLNEKVAKAPKKPAKERFNDFIDQFYNREYREFLSKDAMGWLKLSAFYAVFYFWLACFFCTMLFMFWVVRIRGQTLPVYYNTDSVMHYKVVNPGLGFRPHTNPESELVHVKVAEPEVNVQSMKNFLEEYEANKDTEFVAAHDEKVKFNYEEVLKDSPCSAENQFGLASNSPCVAVKLNRIIGWLPEPATLDQFPVGLNDTIEMLEKNDKVNPSKYVYVSCSGQDGVDRDNIEEIEYYSSHYNNQVGGINFKYFPYQNQENYLSPLIFVHFKKVSTNTLINILCKAYAGNIDNEDRLNQRGMTKFQLFIETAQDKEEL